MKIKIKFDDVKVKNMQSGEIIIGNKKTTNKIDKTITNNKVD